MPEMVSRWADIVRAKGVNPKLEHHFIHPIVQALMIFMGETACLIAFYSQYYYHEFFKKNSTQFGSQKFSTIVFIIPACCDALATSLVFVGLNLTYASSFQMLHSTVIIFTSLLLVAFLESTLHWYRWVGMITVIAGSVIVGLKDIISYGGGDPNSVLTGDLLIVFAQLINAIQMVVEERYVKGYNIPPLQGVGWEGVFGFFIMIPMYFLPWNLPSGPDFWQDQTHFENVIDAFHQVFYIPTLTTAFFEIIISTALFNFTGLTVTRELSAATRVILQNIRIITVWLISLGFHWEIFNYFQPIGCVLILLGTFIYCNIVLIPGIRRLYVYCWWIMKSNDKETNMPGIEPLIQVTPRWRRSH